MEDTLEKTIENNENEGPVVKDIYRPGDDVKGTIVAIDRSTVYIDLPPSNTGIIYGSEFLAARDI